MKAICTIGMGPDIIVDLEGATLVLYESPIMKNFRNGYVTQGSIDLTKDEAENLAHQLLNAVDECKRFDLEMEDYFKNKGV